ncbi:MAG: cupredoxin domain-containing protein [Myxococcales bacterium]|nr:cupredoxin domain-containing protein [Myxococcales bacterium]
MKALLVATLLAAAPAARNLEMKVTDKGFEPSRIEVKKGEPLHLLVTRKTDATCAKELVIEDAGLRKALPLDKTVAFDFTPNKAGEMTYVCGMGMISGTLVVQ